MTRCMHCERDIQQLATGVWVDADGFTACMKRVGDFPLLLHAPMPMI